MKKRYLIIFFLIICRVFVFADDFVSDVSLQNEIILAHENKYYPGIVDKVEQLEKKYPDSVFLTSALLYKADALINIYQFDKAVETLNLAGTGIYDVSESAPYYNYLMGKAFYYKKDYSDALESFYKTCVTSRSRNCFDYYYSAVLYSARCFYSLEKYEQAYPLYEVVISNGKEFSTADYSYALRNLMLSYNKSNQYRKTVELFNQLEKQKLGEDLYNTLCLYAADAHKDLEQNEEAYRLYCSVLESGNKTHAVVALKKAYILSSEKNIGVNPGDVFSKTVNTFADEPELVKEFWIRLGIDEYNKKNYLKAKEYFGKIEDENPLVVLYTSKILIDNDKDFDKAEKCLESYEPKVGKVKIENYSDSFYSVLLQVKCIHQKFKDAVEVFKKIKNPSYEAVYNVSTAYYELKEYQKVSPETGVLYASALAKSGDYTAAAKVFENTPLTSEDRGEYAKVLFILGQYEKAYEQSRISTDTQKEYVSALCLINTKNWNGAKSHFNNYIKQNSGKNDFINTAFFYKGYAEYCMEEYKNAYVSFVRFCSEDKGNQSIYIRKSYEYAAKSALQTGDFQNAAIQAENVIKSSGNLNDKHDAVLFCAEIFADYENYDKALQVLLPYTNEKSDFAEQALFSSAKIYEKQGNVQQAFNFYERVYTENSKSVLAEEAMYRTGELYYSHQNYVTALGCFNKYIYKYPLGKFSDGAMFFCGDCSLRLNETDRAINMNKILIQKYPESVYAYGANKNLLEAYYLQESYSLALETAEIIVKKYPEQAASDEIGRRLINLERIVSGTDKRVAEKQSEFEKLGKEKTKKGRIAGTQLVQLYAESSDTQEKAFTLAVLLLSGQTSPDEIKYAAENAEFIADYYRRNSQNQKSAQMYLQTAEYFRIMNDDARAAGALYGAAEAFVSGDYMGDAEETAGLLLQLYPDSKQAERVERLLK